MMEGWSCIILGATGDLSQRKLLPALYHVIGETEATQDDIVMCGAAYEKADFAQLWDNAAEHLQQIDHDRLTWLKEASWYQSIDFTSSEGFHAFAERIAQEERRKGLPGKRLVYLAVPADFFCQLTQHLVEAGIVEAGNQDHRIVYEKPFGWDLASARDINGCIRGHDLEPAQIYRVDHYLTKEFISNIVLLRFTNHLFEATWSNAHIQRVEISCKEELTVSERGEYYDRYGAIRDMIQSHMLQMLALTAMERPDMAMGRGMEDEKADVLKNTRFVRGVRGQYEGYHDEPGVAPDSTTETAAALEWRIDTPRWQGVPWYTFTGKALDEKLTEIRIVYQPAIHALFHERVVCDPDELVIRVAPQAGFVLHVNSKQPNSMRDIMPVTMDFCHSCQFAPYTREAYEALLLSVIAGEQSISVSDEEIEAQWKLTEQAISHGAPRMTYEQGDDGQAFMHALKKHAD